MAERAPQMVATGGVSGETIPSTFTQISGLEDVLAAPEASCNVLMGVATVTGASASSVVLAAVAVGIGTAVAVGSATSSSVHSGSGASERRGVRMTCSRHRIGFSIVWCASVATANMMTKHGMKSHGKSPPLPEPGIVIRRTLTSHGSKNDIQ